MVRDDESDAFARVLRGVKARTGVGAVLNTSYNIHGEPMVCAPKEAIDVYLRTEADALAIGSYLVVRDVRY